jgi:O-antigen biosynthesis protein
MIRPALTVVVPTYNRRRYLRETLLSLLADRGVETEILVVDDGSTDGSEATLRDLRVRYRRLARNRGLSHARNVGLEEASGDLVTFFDSDDILLPGALTARVRAMEERPGLAAVAGVIGGEIDADGNALSHPCPLIPGEPLTLDFFLRGRRYCAAPWLYVYRRETLRRLGGFDESLRIACDSDLLFRLLALGPIPVIPVGVLLYRRHDANISVMNPAAPTPRPLALAESFLVNASHGIFPKGHGPWVG